MWIIDDSGPTKELIERVEALEYSKFVDNVKGQRTFAKLQLDVAEAESKKKNANANENFASLKSDIATIDAQISRMDEGDEALFEAARTAVLVALHMVPTSHAGVCARAMRNPTDAPKGQTLSISVSGFSVE